MSASQMFFAMEPFDASTMQWDRWISRYEEYVLCNPAMMKAAQEDDTQHNRRYVATFLMAIGPTAFQVLENLTAPDKPKDRKLDDLANLLRDHYQPAKTEIAERFKFNQRRQNNSESATQYLAELRRLAIPCNFGGYLDQALRDRFVCGLRTEAIQKRLLAETDLKLTKALEVALAMEAAERSTRELHGSTHDNSDTVNSIRRVHHRQTNSNNNADNRNRMKATSPANRQQRRSNSQSSGGSGDSNYSRNHSNRISPNYVCWRCKGQGTHHHSKCKFKDYTCNKCFQLGHLAYACEEKPSSTARHNVRNYSSHHGNNSSSHNSNHANDDESYRNNQRTNYVENDYSSDFCNLWENNSIRIANVDSNNSNVRAPTIRIGIEQSRFQIEVDTGSAFTIVSEETLRQQLPTVQIEPTNVRILSYTGQQLPIIGKAIVRVTANKSRHRLPIIIVRGNHHFVLGRDWMSRLNLDWNRLFSQKSMPRPPVNIVKGQPSQRSDATPPSFENYRAQNLGGK